MQGKLYDGWRKLASERSTWTKTSPFLNNHDSTLPRPGGIVNATNPQMPADIEENGQRAANRKWKADYRKRLVRMQCFPLYSVLMALGNPTVHYFSLDIEGAELQVGKSKGGQKVFECREAAPDRGQDGVASFMICTGVVIHKTLRQCLHRYTVHLQGGP